MFIDDDFLLTTATAKFLYHTYAKEMPIIDYHCHLEPKLIAENYQFISITELWLGGDHYKWRAMRANGIPEKLITGDGADWEKFEAWAATVENLVGNPLHHWTHLELKEYFKVTELLTKDNAKEIYNHCNEILANGNFTTDNLIKNSKVKYIGTTDDILSDLLYHQQISTKADYRVAPSFRPDPILNINQDFATYIAKCSDQNKQLITSYPELKVFLIDRVHFFNDNGGKIADHGFKEFLFNEATTEEIENIFQKGLSGKKVSREELAKWQGRVMVDLGKEYAKLNWTMQLHFGAIRSNNSRLLNELGSDIGTDSIFSQGDIAEHLNTFLDALDTTDELPKTILYNLDGTMNDVVASVCGNFQSNGQGIKSKIQFGAGWWFNDTYRGMRNQLETLSDQGTLMNFVGMLTDSRSFISYPRHDYFRRILCDFIGENVESGFYPNDEILLQKLTENICYKNAKEYFEL